MNTLMLFCGIGIGTFISTVTMLFVMSMLSRTSKKWHCETTKLMEERNEIAKEGLTHLRTLAMYADGRLSP